MIHCKTLWKVAEFCSLKLKVSTCNKRQEAHCLYNHFTISVATTTCYMYDWLCLGWNCFWLAKKAVERLLLPLSQEQLFSNVNNSCACATKSQNYRETTFSPINVMVFFYTLWEKTVYWVLYKYTYSYHLYTCLNNNRMWAKMSIYSTKTFTRRDILLMEYHKNCAYKIYVQVWFLLCFTESPQVQFSYKNSLCTVI